MDQSCTSCGAKLDAVDAAATLVQCPGCSASLVPAGATAISMVAMSQVSGDGAPQVEVQQKIALSPEFMERYRVERLLGAGAMGVVYKAHDTFRDVPVAVKVLNLHGEAHTARFRREGRVMGQLTHANVVRVFDTLEVDGHPCLICEYVTGGSLEERIKAGPILVPEAARIIRELLAGLQACHELKILHRDIKPANVLLEGGKMAKLADFGLARVGETGDEGGTLTRAGDRLGTPRYMAPEQFEQGGASVATDVYAVGVMLYEMVTGQVPFPGRTLALLFDQKRAGLARLDETVSGVRRGFGDVVASATAVNPKDRPGSAAIFSEMLLGAMRAGPTPRPKGQSGGFAADTVPSPAVTPARGVTGRTPKLPVTAATRAPDANRRALVAAASAFVVTAGLVGTALFWTRPPATPASPAWASVPASVEAAVAASDAPFLGIFDLKVRPMERAVYVQLRTLKRVRVSVVMTEAKNPAARFVEETPADFVKRAVFDRLEPNTEYRLEVKPADADWRVSLDPLVVRTLADGYRKNAIRDQQSETAAGLTDNPNADLRIFVRHGEDADVPRILDELNVQTPTSRWATAADVFGVIGHPAAVPKLALGLKSTPKLGCDPWVDAMLRSLGDIGGDGAVAALEEFVRNGCAEDAGAPSPLSPTTAVDEVNPSRRRRFLAARCLVRADPDRALKLFDVLRSKSDRLGLALYGASLVDAPWRDAAAMKALALPESKEVSGTNPGLRVAALRGLPDMDLVAKALPRTWSRLSDMRLRMSLGSFGGDGAIPALADDLSRGPWNKLEVDAHQSWTMAAHDMAALGQLGARASGEPRAQAARALSAALAGPVVRQHAALRRIGLRGLARIALPASAPGIEASYARDPSPRAEHAIALARCGSARAPAAINALLESQRLTDLWAAAVAAAALPPDLQEPRWKRIRERVEQVKNPVVQRELKEGMTWLAGGALARPLVWLDSYSLLTPTGVKLHAGQRFGLVAHGLTALRKAPAPPEQLPDIESATERVPDCLPPGGRLNVGVREFATDGVVLHVGAHFVEPYPKGYPPLVAQDRGMVFARMYFKEIGDPHDTPHGETEMMLKASLIAGFVLAEIKVEK